MGDLNHLQCIQGQLGHRKHIISAIWRNLSDAKCIFFPLSKRCVVSLAAWIILIVCKNGRVVPHYDERSLRKVNF